MEQMIKRKYLKYLIDCNANTIDALKKINTLGGASLIVTKNKNILAGILSSRDLRKAILANTITNKKIKKIYNSNPKFIYSDELKKKIKEIIFNINKINIIPVVEKKTKKITDILTNDKINLLKKKKKNRLKASVVIMAGGRGERLMPYTSVLPKPLLPINEKPTIQHIIDKFNQYTPENLFVTINYKSEILESYLKEFRKKNTSISIITIKEKKPLGTAGSLFFIKKQLKDNFFLTNCDTIINSDYNEIYSHHIKKKNDITIVTAIKKFEVPYGVCTVSNNNFSMKEKPKFSYNANTGFYVIKKDCLKVLKKEEHLNFNDFLLNCQKQNKKIGIFEINENRWTDVGQMKEYKKNINKQV